MDTSLPTIGICGGGNLSHAMAAWLSRSGYPVRIVTRRPQDWGTQLSGHFYDKGDSVVPMLGVSGDYASLADCRFIFVSGPRFAIPPICAALKPHLCPDQLLVIAPGTPEVQKMEGDELWQDQPIIALYKVPLICRTETYGHEVSILGGRALNRAWLSAKASEHDLATLEDMFSTPIARLTSAWPFLLTNSNPLLHPSRMVRLFHNYSQGVTYDRNFYFYGEWGQDSSELYLAADAELLEICAKCPGMVIGKDIVPITEYYESQDAAALTRKLRSIESLKCIHSPMAHTANGWIPDFSSRYFTEDVPYGTALICQYARQLGVSTPTLDYYVQWNQDMLKLASQLSSSRLQYSQYCSDNR